MWVWYVNSHAGWPGSPGPHRFVIGVYGHPPDPSVEDIGIHAYPIKNTWSNEVLHAVSAYAAKSALWVARLPLP